MGFREFLKNTVAALRFAIGRGDYVSEKRIIKFAKTMNPSKEAFESVGFEFSDSDDPNTFEVKLPDGWRASKCIGWDVRHYHNIYDEKNRRRVWYLYGVSPFGGSYGHSKLLCRYNVQDKFVDERECEYYDDADMMVTYISDRALSGGDDCLCEIGKFKFDEDDLESSKDLFLKACAFLDENYPDWQNPLAYWD